MPRSRLRLAALPVRAPRRHGGVAACLPAVPHYFAQSFAQSFAVLRASGAPGTLGTLGFQCALGSVWLWAWLCGQRGPREERRILRSGGRATSEERPCYSVPAALPSGVRPWALLLCDLGLVLAPPPGAREKPSAGASLLGVSVESRARCRCQPPRLKAMFQPRPGGSMGQPGKAAQPMQTHELRNFPALTRNTQAPAQQQAFTAPMMGRPV